VLGRGGGREGGRNEWWGWFWEGLPSVACGADGVFGVGVAGVFDEVRHGHACVGRRGRGGWKEGEGRRVSEWVEGMTKGGLSLERSAR